MEEFGIQANSNRDCEISQKWRFSAKAEDGSGGIAAQTMADMRNVG
jgi:hypothetical protein